VSGHGGVVFRVAGDPYFLPASIAMKVIPVPAVARVPGGPPELRGVALVDGDMIPVVNVAGSDPPPPTGEAMLLCAVVGERLGLVGIDVVATGRFEADDETGEIKVGSGTEKARTFDVAAVIARVREGRWAV
jgi:hypothetical protein